MPAKYDNCVSKVKKSKSADNAYAVCNASLGKAKEGKTAKDGHLSSSNGAYGPKAFLNQWFTKAKPYSFKPEGVVMEDEPVADPTMALAANKIADDIVAENPSISIATFLNLLKSKGVDLTLSPALVSEASSSSQLPELTRESAKPNAGNLNFRAARFLEAAPGADTPPGAFTRFKTVLLAEGPGNFKDGYYYTKDALKSAIKVFEGKKIYADHPTALQEKIQPERSVRDVLGHFENVHVEEADGQAQLVGDVVIPPDNPFLWARSLMGHAVEYAKKYPDKDFVGLSINASGDATETEIQAIEASAPPSAKIKLQKSKELGNTTIKLVTNIAEAISCDLVTEAGAGGKILELLEGDIKMSKKKIKEADEAKEKKERKEGDEPAPSSDAAMGAKEPHDDEQQDADLIKKMIAKYLSADQMASEEECGMVKEAYEACKEMGMPENEAAETAVKQLKLAKHMAAKQAKEAVDVDAQQGVVGGSPAEAEPMMQAKESDDEDDDKKDVKESNVITLTAKVASLEQEIKKYQVKDYVETMLEKSKLGRAITNGFRPFVEGAKSTQEVDKLFKLFEAGLKSTKAVGGSALFENLVIQPEKTTGAGGKAVSFDGIFKK